MKISEINVGERYFLEGDIANGHLANGELRLTHEEVTRKVVNISPRFVICECGRRFLINDKLKIKKI